ncbi:MAG: DAK2 domain-containing protein [Candidatus Nanopelagicales bacterium]|nr:DAK2 domain-containing protein [Candidatus Nanopelagicales bacterium]
MAPQNDELDAQGIQTWAYTALTALGEARAEIDALNVFPVPDSDTGTNVFLTIEAACHDIDQALDAPGHSRSSIARALAHGALLGARGNSGVIISQIFRGCSDALAKVALDRPVSGADVAEMLRLAADMAYAAVTKPVEGTILTVARAAADAALAAVAADGEAGIGAVVTHAAAAAQDALEQTPQLLEALRRAGVVDAGGRAYVVILDALVSVVTGVRKASAASYVSRPRTTDVEPNANYSGPAYEVMFLLDATAPAVDIMRARLGELGDSLVVVGGESLWNVHVHVDDAGAAVEAAIAAGLPYRIRITHLEVANSMIDQVARGVVAVAHGPGTASLMESLGVTIVAAQPGQRPSTKELLNAITALGAAEVILLPSDKDTWPVAEVAAEQARAANVRVSVVPTRSIVQTLAAIAVHENSSRFEDDVVAMTRAAGATRYGAVTIAVRQALTTVGQCQVGDVLGLVDGDIVILGRDIVTVIRELLQGMLAVGGELVTLVSGLEVGTEITDGIPKWLQREFPLVDINIYDGGQPLWPLIIGVE